MLLDIDQVQWIDVFKKFQQNAVASMSTIGVIDPVIEKTIVHLNEYVGVATVFSCQGHPYEQDRHGAEMVGPDKGYIMMVVKCSCDQTQLFRMLHTINAKLWTTYDEYARFDIEVDITKGMGDITGDPEIMYPSITIRTPFFNNTRIRNRWWNRFHTALREYA